MTNAAIYMHPNGFDTTSGRLLGRHSAGESFLRGFLRHADVERFYFWHAGGATISALEALIERIQPIERPKTWITTTNRPGIGEVGVLHLPGPNLGDEAWARRVYGPNSYSICGLTHTTATARVMEILSQYATAPLSDHDALICTSSAVRDSVETQLAGVREYLAEAYGGPRRSAEVQRVTIPLGVNAAEFETTPEQRKAWRERLDIPEDAVVALYVGRFNTREKMNPALMALALEKAAQATGKPIYWVNSGWAESEAENTRYHDGARALCPSVHYREVDGRPADVRFSIWSVGDFFISLSDNIQETFGLTPVEAMAAGLPCVVTDWNGYRDTVGHGEHGFRIPTIAPAPGEGIDLAYWYANDWLSYVDYVGAASQLVAIDFAESTAAISALVQNADLRRRLGRQAQAHVRAMFDWSQIVPQYQALWADLDARRRLRAPAPSVRDNPYRPDPFRLFGGYPTQHPSTDWNVQLGSGVTWPDAKALLTRPITNYSHFNRPSLDEVETIVAWLAVQPRARVSDLVQIFPAHRRSAVARGLLWIARYGVIVLRPPG
ncbi:glycosyltransferase family 4 protein [Phenylobacterium sp.]|jgi:glycosyltransferase involved in cell wall biosynthesis|uniref:glycosyltransferase family 4 protein n=1 Tax=Phenylobacterium sp. TaxID=1871053 RepID=UPI002E357525|nr:glycosyltransferase family 4 protein [Phenylobacterium sp.]HEX4709764.1 glycosyltransferase family 4 protein [Phenylobacterium sp.]